MASGIPLGEVGLIILAGLGAGFVNAIAGGGTLISFPALVAIGISPVVANLTSTVALVPGYLGATLAQRRDLKGQEQRLGWLVPTALGGGVTGAVLLLNTNEALFNFLIPYLLLLAAGLLALQERVRSGLLRRMSTQHSTLPEGWVIPLVFLAAVYGGYFGAGLSVILLAVLGLVLEETLTRLNGLKQLLAFGVNTAAALFFVFSGEVLWPVALLMAIAAVIGGLMGGKLARFVQPAALRAIVITASVIVAILYFVRNLSSS